MRNKEKGEPMATNYAVAPGEFLQEWIEEEGRGITQAELALRLGVSRKLVNEILNGKAPITPETALKLDRVTSIPSSAWLLYEAQYRDDLTRLNDEQHVEGAASRFRTKDRQAPINEKQEIE